MLVTHFHHFQIVLPSADKFLLPSVLRVMNAQQLPNCSSSIYRGELSFLQPVHFCICWHDSAVLTSYLFRQWPACMHVPNWENVLGVSAVIRCVWRVPNWKNVLCCKMCMVTSGMSRCHARSTTSDARMGNTSDARVVRSYNKNFPVSRYLYSQCACMFLIGKMSWESVLL